MVNQTCVFGPTIVSGTVLKYRNSWSVRISPIHLPWRVRRTQFSTIICVTASPIEAHAAWSTSIVHPVVLPKDRQIGASLTVWWKRQVSFRWLCGTDRSIIHQMLILGFEDMVQVEIFHDGLFQQVSTTGLTTCNDVPPQLPHKRPALLTDHQVSRLREAHDTTLVVNRPASSS